MMTFEQDIIIEENPILRVKSANRTIFPGLLFLSDSISTESHNGGDSFLRSKPSNTAKVDINEPVFPKDPLVI